ncbi:MAG TPA: cupredoxin domain-containing protein [Candidatus Sulfotelmatobacter sp.]|nr:cupredoxin domain-containing protein [Candidatus Sulfotelmatobacter sp.]
MQTIFAAALLLAATAAPVAAPAPSATVHIRNDAFVPARVVVKPGTIVVFVNDDDDAHTATADNGSYDSGGLGTGESWKHAYTSAGSYAYHCTMHPFMKGIVMVKP